MTNGIVKGRSRPIKPSAFKTRNKRLKNFWEPVFNPSFAGITSEFSWDTSRTTGVKFSLCGSEALKKIMDEKDAQRWSVKDYGFENCDFIGHFLGGLSFSRCTFKLCDLGYTTWKSVKFANCTFDRCSFTLATFEHCQFIGCTWKDTGLSGTETKLFDTVIDHPIDIIDSAYTNLDKAVLEQNGTDPSFQQMKLEETKQKFARSMLLNNERNGDDSTYYESIKAYLTQSIVARKAKAAHQLKGKQRSIGGVLTYLMCPVENLILKASGAMNGWGSSLARPSMIGVALIAVFALIYWCLGIGTDFKGAMIASFDVSLLIGYTKQASNSISWNFQVLFALNALLGLWWYAIFVPTVINRICRVR